MKCVRGEQTYVHGVYKPLTPLIKSEYIVSFVEHACTDLSTFQQTRHV